MASYRGAAMKAARLSSALRCFSSSSAPPSSRPRFDWSRSAHVLGVTGAVLAGLVTVREFGANVVFPVAGYVEQLSFSFAKTQASFNVDVGPTSTYVSRPIIEKQIEAVLEMTAPLEGFYFILYGPKGSGKTSAVARCVRGKKGTIKITGIHPPCIPQIAIATCLSQPFQLHHCLHIWYLQCRPLI